MKKDTCTNCKAFAPLTKECRRHAPVAFPVPQQDRLGNLVNVGAAGIFPATDPEKWCCEFVPDAILQ